MSQAAPILLTRLWQEKKIDGVISLGGGGGTAIATAAMRALPIGFPKLMVSTLASGNTAQYVGVRDIVMFPSIVDVAGLNRISRQILTRAAGAICGMVEVVPPVARDKPIIAASMFGNTNTCVQHARKILETAGYEVLIFHATGTGGRVMESLIESGMVAGVLDLTTTEWADEVVGGVLGAGPTRLEAAARMGVPAVVGPGCLDMVNFWARSSVPERFNQRQFYIWNPNVTLMRTNVGENAELGRILAEKANAASAPVAFFLPKLGVSVLDSPGGEFWWPEADAALFAAIKANAKPGTPVYELENNINDPAFAEAVVAKLLEFIKK